MMRSQPANSSRHTKASKQLSILSRIQAYSVNHIRAFAFSLSRLYLTPFASLLTLLVIGVALAMPGILFVMLNNTYKLAAEWETNPGITIFVHEFINDSELHAFADTLLERIDIAAVQTMTRQETLDEFSRLSGFVHAIDIIDKNTFPALIMVTPDKDHRRPSDLRKLSQEFENHELVESVIVDLLWIERFYSLVKVMQRGTEIFTLLLVLTVLLVISNSVRLDIYNRRSEIEVSKLVGASDAFVRRPFLYGGFLLGLLGAIVAMVIVYAMLFLLKTPIMHLVTLYDSSFSLVGPEFEDIAWIFSTGCLLGLFGSWISVNYHLQDIEPR